MFGDERGGGTNVRYGLKPMKNAEAQRLYYEEVAKVVRDLNLRYLRARIPELGRPEAEALLDEILADGETRQGVRPEDLLRMPHPDFFRRRGVPAFTLVGTTGEIYTDLAEYLKHLAATLPESYLANRDFRDYAEALGQVARGEMDVAAATSRMPALRRVGGACSCSKAVRWIYDEPLVIGSTAAGVAAPQAEPVTAA
jgi:hypothetical protein